jgi:hypothetical protein
VDSFKEHLKQQQQLRKEVNIHHQNALTGKIESLIVNHNQLTGCIEMTS